MRIELNGSDQEVRDGVSVGELVRSLVEAPERGVAAALEGAVVPRGEWDATTVEEGQRLEVVRAVQGG